MGRVDEQLLHIDLGLLRGNPAPDPRLDVFTNHHRWWSIRPEVTLGEEAPQDRTDSKNPEEARRGEGSRIPAGIFLTPTHGDLVLPIGAQRVDGAVEPIPESDSVREQAAAAAVRDWESFTGAPPIWPSDFSSPRECTEVDRKMMQMCRTLDGREYIKGRIQAGGVCAFLRAVSDDLASEAPELASELKSYPAMLQNVFHLFRTLGPKRLALLSEIAGEETADQEAIAFTTFQWLVSRERCTKAVQSDITLDGLYDYAGFVLQTMGGQAYLRRRPPATGPAANPASDRRGIHDQSVQVHIGPVLIKDGLAEKILTHITIPNKRISVFQCMAHHLHQFIQGQIII